MKNRVGPPFRTTIFEMHFASGINNYSGWLNALKDFNVITSAGAWYTYTNKETGEETKFQAKDFTKLMTENIELHDKFYDLLADKMIMKYVKRGSEEANKDIDNVTVEKDDSLND